MDVKFRDNNYVILWNDNNNICQVFVMFKCNLQLRALIHEDSIRTSPESMIWIWMLESKELSSIELGFQESAGGGE